MLRRAGNDSLTWAADGTGEKHGGTRRTALGTGVEGAPQQLVVLCHGLGADGHDLIDLAPTWAHALPDALFVSVGRAVSAHDRASAGNGGASPTARPR